MNREYILSQINQFLETAALTSRDQAFKSAHVRSLLRGVKTLFKSETSKEGNVVDGEFTVIKELPSINR